MCVWAHVCECTCMCVHMCGIGFPATLQKPRLGHFPASLRAGVPPEPPEGAAGMTRPREQRPSGLSFPPYVKAG